MRMDCGNTSTSSGITKGEERSSMERSLQQRREGEPVHLPRVTADTLHATDIAAALTVYRHRGFASCVQIESRDRLAAIVEREIPSLHFERFNSPVISFERALISNGRAMHQSGGELHAVFQGPGILHVARQALGTEDIEMKVLQVNRLKAGDFIARHTDKAQAAEYELAVILYGTEVYAGGNFQLVATDGETVEMKAPPLSLVLVQGDLYHEVQEVTSGCRETVVAIYGRPR